jgi:hypothetical protein
MNAPPRFMQKTDEPGVRQAVNERMAREVHRLGVVHG